MKWFASILATLLICTAAASAQQSAPEVRPLADAERETLASLDAGDLGVLRAAAGPRETGLETSEHGVLARAQAANEDLAALRAGDLSDREVELILITVAVVVAIAIVL
jgi:hypothetical protein